MEIRNKDKLIEWVTDNPELKGKHTLIKYIECDFSVQGWSVYDRKLLHTKSKIALKDYYESKGKKYKKDKKIKEEETFIINDESEGVDGQ